MIEVLHGDCREVLKTLPDASVQMCVTSPPYYGLRDYGVDAQLGLEATPDEYVANMVAVFREVRRVLRPDGVLFLNIGDSYFGGGGYSPGSPSNQTDAAKARGAPGAQINGARIKGRAASRIGDLKPKDLIGIPWMLAFALRADGWWLRSDIVWAKGRDGDTEDCGPGNCMPESVTDRPTRSHEYVFLLSKSSDYFYDADAIKEQAIKTDMRETTFKRNGTKRNDIIIPGHTDMPHREARADTLPNGTRNARSVWIINTTAYPGAHYAVFPERLVERCILAGSSPQACEHCGAPWERVVERGKTINRTTENGDGNGQLGSYGRFGDAVISTRSWQPTCQCDNTGSGQCVVLDPFFGSGTTGRVALRHGRACIGIELNAAYLEQIEQRTNGVQTSMAGVL